MTKKARKRLPFKTSSRKKAKPITKQKIGKPVGLAKKSKATPADSKKSNAVPSFFGMFKKKIIEWTGIPDVEEENKKPKRKTK